MPQALRRHVVVTKRRASAPLLSSTQTPKLRLAPKTKRPSAEIAAERLLDLITEIGEDMDMAWGWKAEAARQLGIHYQTAIMLTLGITDRIGLAVIDQVRSKIKISLPDLMEER